MSERWAAQRRYQERNKHPCACGALIHKTSQRCKACDRRWRVEEMSNRPVRLRHGFAKRVKGKQRPEYYIWASLIQRCTNPSAQQYENYGGRGIRVCVRWRVFENFLADMGPRPRGEHPSGRAQFTIDRKNNNGNYTPKNCVWATYKEQGTHRTTSHVVRFRGERMTLQQWSEKLCIRYKTLHNRLVKLGWSAERALTEAVRPKRDCEPR